MSVLKTNTKRKPAHTAEPTYMGLLRAGGMGFLLGIALVFVLAMLLAAIALKSGEPQAIVFPASLIAMFAGGYGGALLGAKRSHANGMNPYLGGLTAGGMLLLFSLILSLFFKNTENQTVLMRLSPSLVLSVASLLGSLTAAMHKTSAKKRIRKLTRTR